MFRTLNTDNTDNEVIIQGARSKSSNADIASLVFRNFDDDTKQTYRMAEIAMRDAFGDASSNGFGSLVFYTNGSGTLCNAIPERMIIDHRGYVGVNNTRPAYTVDVNGDIRIASNIICPVIEALSNAAYYASNVANGGEQAVANLDGSWASNVFIETSNALYPRSLWASNIAFETSNVAFETSNALYPRSLWASNVAFETSNALYPRSLWASNVAFETSNALYPRSLWASNVAFETSNALYPRSAWASNVAFETSNALYTKPSSYLNPIAPVKIDSVYYTNVYTLINDASDISSASPTSIIIGSYLYSASNMEISSSNFLYYIRAYDATLNTVLGQVTRSNNIQSVVTLPLSNVNNTGMSRIEIHAKKGSLGDFVQIDSLSIKYELQ